MVRNVNVKWVDFVTFAPFIVVLGNCTVDCFYPTKGCYVTMGAFLCFIYWSILGNSLKLWPCASLAEGRQKSYVSSKCSVLLLICVLLFNYPFLCPLFLAIVYDYVD